MGRANHSTLLREGILTVGNTDISYEVRAELRRNTRYSLTRKKAYLRVPKGIDAVALREAHSAFEAWLRKAGTKRPDLLQNHNPTTFTHGQVYRLGEYAYRLAIAKRDQKSASAKTSDLVNGDDGIPVLPIFLPRPADQTSQGELIEKLLFRVVAKRASGNVMARLRQINEAHFNVPVTRLKLSPTRSRWGSCSTSGTISISTLLLGAPARCLHAVLVHELAHGLEMNHSSRFWKLVHDAMPDYDAAHSWLKAHGSGLGWQLEETAS